MINVFEEYPSLSLRKAALTEYLVFSVCTMLYKVIKLPHAHCGIPSNKLTAKFYRFPRRKNSLITISNKAGTSASGFLLKKTLYKGSFG